jgi:hypothetical protein
MDFWPTIFQARENSGNSELGWSLFLEITLQMVLGIFSKPNKAKLFHNIDLSLPIILLAA